MTDGEQLAKEVKRLLRRGSAEAALRLSLLLLAHTDAPAAAYDAWVKQAETAARELADPRLAAYLALYRRDLAQAAALLPQDRYPLELGHALSLAQRADPAESAKLGSASAGELFQAAGQLVLAGRAYAAAGSLDSAIRCYRQLLGHGRLGLYEQALVHYHIAETMHRLSGSPPGGAGPVPSKLEARRHALFCQERLESVADEYERAGDIDRALDCCRLYIRLGQVLGSFENIAEGYVSCLRLLKDERRTLDVLRHCEELLAACGQAGEHHLLAEKCGDVATYLDKQQPAWAGLYRRRAAEALAAAASHNEARGGAVRLTESMLLQAAGAWNSLGDLLAVGAVFRRLSRLPAEKPEEMARRRRYAELCARYPSTQPAAGEAEPAPLPSLPAYVTEEQAQPPVWDQDLVEWQAAGDPVAVSLALLCDGERSRPQLTRRNALLVLLYAGMPQPPDAPRPARAADPQLRTIEALAGLRCYEALHPLERLFDTACAAEPPAAFGAAHDQPKDWASLGNPTPAVLIRRTIIQALPRLPFRRSLALIVRGLQDPDLGVYTASLDALASASFPDAVSGLVRLYRSQPAPPFEVRRAALHALGRSRDPRAAELLTEVARKDAEPLAGDASRLLSTVMARVTETR